MLLINFRNERVCGKKKKSGVFRQHAHNILSQLVTERSTRGAGFCIWYTGDAEKVELYKARSVKLPQVSSHPYQLRARSDARCDSNILSRVLASGKTIFPRKRNLGRGKFSNKGIHTRRAWQRY